MTGATTDTRAGAQGAPSSREVALAAARAAIEKQAEDVLVLDVGSIIVITDFFVICTAGSQRQIKTVIEAVQDAARELGVKPVRREGEADAGWWLLDFVDVVVHVFGSEERAFYSLERLWSDAPKVRVQDAGAASSAR